MTTKTEKIERVVTEEVTKFIATDGTEFPTSDECEKYEASAVCAVVARLSSALKKLDNKMLYRNGIDYLVDNGCSEGDYFAFEPKTEDDIKNLIAYLTLRYPDCVARNYFNPDMSEEARKVRDERAKWYFPERFEDLKVGCKYILYSHYDWCQIVSEERLIECVKHGFKTMFDKYEEPKAE